LNICLALRAPLHNLGVCFFVRTGLELSRYPDVFWNPLWSILTDIFTAFFNLQAKPGILK